MKINLKNNSPIQRNIIANLFGIVVQLLNQIVLVPFYILFWGNDLYSDWIVISALTTIFSMSDVGLNNVIQNRFTIKYAEGEKDECESLLTNNFILIGVTLLFSMIGICFFITNFDITKVMNLHTLSRNDANWVFVLLILKVFIGMLSNVEDAIYRATHNASIAKHQSNIALLAITFITFICIYFKISIIALCVLISLPQLILIIVKYIHSQKLFKYYFSVKSFDWKLMKKIILPSFTFMSFPIGNSIVLQGFTLVVNKYFGADSVVLYNTTRTLCNFIKTFLATLQTAVWPEYSIAYGKGDFVLMRHLHRKILKITFVLSCLIGLALIILGPYIYEIWTRGAVIFDYSLMITYVLVLISESVWTSSSVTLMATNNHSKLGVVYISASVLALGVALIVSMYFQNLWLIAASLIIMHVIIAIYAIPEGFRLTKDSLLSRIKI